MNGQHSRREGSAGFSTPQPHRYSSEPNGHQARPQTPSANSQTYQRYPSQSSAIPASSNSLAQPVRTNAGRLDRHASIESRNLQQKNQMEKRAKQDSMAQQGYSLRPAANNRLFLSIRSGIPSEISYGLDHLLKLSYKGELSFALFPGSIESLLDLVEIWVRDIEREHVRWKEGCSEVIDSGEEAEERETRGIEALLILRNAIYSGDSSQNKQVIIGVKTRPALEQISSNNGQALPPRLLSLIGRLFGGLDGVDVTAEMGEEIQVDGLLRVTTKHPEPLIYMLDILLGIFPVLAELLEGPEAPAPDEPNETAELEVTMAMLTTRLLRSIVLKALPPLFLTTGDVGCIIPLTQLFTLIPPSLLPSSKLIHKLVSFLLLTPGVGSGTIDRHTGKTITQPSPYPPELLTNSLNLLYHLTRETTISTSILKSSDISEYLRVLTRLLKWNAREVTLALPPAEPAGSYHAIPEPGAQVVPEVHVDGKIKPNQTKVALKQDDGKEGTGEGVGLGPAIPMSEEKKKRIRAMKEPERSYAWINETFIAQPDSSVAQVVFWRAYSEFVAPSASGPAIPQGGTAGDVIKNATAVFPGANAMVINKDEQGRPLPQNVFVIAGIRFKRSVGRARTYLCRWEGCDSPSGYLSPEALYQHLKEKHVTPITSTADEPIPCRWSACRFKHATFSHMATHIPPPLDPTKEPTIRRLITHPASSADSINSPFVTYRQPPTLPPDHRLRYSGLLSPLDSHGQPASDAFYAALVLRNLAKSLREDIERNEDGQGDLENGRQARKRRKMEQEGAFGLPAPPGLLDGNGTANILPGLQQINALSHVERNQARNAFRGIVEETVLDVLGMGGAIAGKLIDCVGI